MTTYKLEIQREPTKAWEDVISFKPNYLSQIERVRYRLFFKREVEIIVNLRAAEFESLEKAKAFAKAMYRKTPCRITATIIEHGVKGSEVVWQNGYSVEHKPHWFWRLLHGGH